MKRILVNRAAVVENARSETADLPIYTVIEGEEIRYGTSVAIMGPSVLCYNPKGDPGLGRRVWIETSAPVVIQGGPSDQKGLDRFNDCCDDELQT